MNIKIIVAGLVMVSSLIGFPTQLIAEPLKITTELSLEKQLELFTVVYGGDIEINKKVIECESQWQTKAEGDSGLSNGIAQFQKASFNRLAKLMGEQLNYDSPYDQLKLFTWSLANGHGREWTAFRAVMNGGSYSFYSKQLQKHFIVKCKL